MSAALVFVFLLLTIYHICPSFSLRQLRYQRLRNRSITGLDETIQNDKLISTFEEFCLAAQLISLALFAIFILVAAVYVRMVEIEQISPDVANVTFYEPGCGFGTHRKNCFQNITLTINSTEQLGCTQSVFVSTVDSDLCIGTIRAKFLILITVVMFAFMVILSHIIDYKERICAIHVEKCQIARNCLRDRISSNIAAGMVKFDNNDPNIQEIIEDYID